MYRESLFEIDMENVSPVAAMLSFLTSLYEADLLAYKPLYIRTVGDKILVDFKDNGMRGHALNMMADFPEDYVKKSGWSVLGRSIEKIIASLNDYWFLNILYFSCHTEWHADTSLSLEVIFGPSLDPVKSYKHVFSLEELESTSWKIVGDQLFLIFQDAYAHGYTDAFPEKLESEWRVRESGERRFYLDSVFRFRSSAGGHNELQV